jgi:TPP-dependent pyruvate/acetoin dehydrogenase alpha subunit
VTAVMPDLPGVRPEVLDAYTAMLRIRLVEETVLAMRLAGTVVGSVHLEMGQEAIPVGVVGARQPGDAVFSTYRGHGWALACGLSVQSLLAELTGRVGGPNDGRGGSAYFTDPEHGFFGENSIVGGGVPIAVGAALAGRFDGSGRAAITAFGDGATNQGAVHESMNMAAAMRLPVLFVCENNGLSELTRIADMVAEPELYRRAAGYGMTGLRVDGNDPFAVRAAAAEALARARAGEGPTFLEVMTQRITGHYIGDAEQYRRPGELDAALLDEPLARIRRQLESAGLDADGIAALEAPVRDEVSAAAAAVEALPFVDPSTVKEHLYG